MMRRKRIWAIATTLALWAVGAADAQAQAASAPTLAVVADGPSDAYRRATRELKRELEALFGDRYPDLALPAEPTHVGEFTDASARAQVEAALNDPEVDLVVSFGVRTGRVVAEVEDLPKPVFLPFAHVEIQGLPRSGASSGRHNLSYLTGLVDLERDLLRFRDVIRRDRVVIVVDSHLLDAIPELKQFAQVWARDSMQVSVVGAGGTVESIVEALPPDAQAVYLGPLLQLPEGEVDPLISALNERGLPTYASEGREWVERGAFVSVVPAGEEERRMRKLALNIDEALAGEDPGEMPTTFERRTQLSINMRTARKLQLWPRFELMTEAVLVGEGEDDRGERLTMRRAVQEALQANLDLGAQRQQIEIAQQRYRAAKGEVAPKIAVEGNFTWIPPQTVFPLFNSERTTDVGLSGQQILYSPGVVGGLRSQRYVVDASKEGVRTSELDVVLNAAVAYLNVLRARTAESINRDFLARVRQNLAMAEVRVEIGASGRQEVFRWQTEIADARVNVLESAAVRNKAEIALNRTLNRPLEQPLQTVEPMDEEGGILIDKRTLELVNDPWSFEVFREFMAEEAVERSPEVAQLDAQVRTQEEVLKARRAQLYAPDVFVHGGITQVLRRAGKGAEDVPPSDDLGGTERLDTQWQFGVTAQMYLFDQTRYVEVDKVSAELNQLRAQRAATAQAIEQRVRSEMLDAGVTSAAMDLREDAADAARENLELVTDAYRKGTVDIITLIDAQNQALASDLRAANAVYDFLIDYVQAERAVGRFGFLEEPAERQAFVTRLVQFYQQRRAEGATPAPGTP